jgi:acyl carrier protein
MDNTQASSGTLEDRILDLVAEESDTPRETLDQTTTLVEIGDSLTRVETVMQLEDEFEVAIPDSDYDGVRTLGELVDLVDAKLRERQNPSEDGHASPASK